MTNAFDWRNFMKEEIKEKEELPQKTQAVFGFTKYKYPYDITGFRFTRLLVIEKEYTDKNYAFWKCLCDCGNNITVRSDNLKGRKTKSCGCIRTENCLKLADKSRTN